ncbi:uncharacterized protein LOC128449632 [Pleuronectes platessa]|uniref:uncharacterized protein LOC128449632 n=1 Tax=Pleuronectes platessa TaxID=8262 RepID=UPI00232A72EB|nr:uncharacterized protein LOC128449632 [Pleuronectes platessa]
MQSTMKLFMPCLLLLPFTTMVLTSPIKGALDTRTAPSMTAQRNPPSRPLYTDSRDMSNSQSLEVFDPIGFTGVSVNNGGGGTVIGLQSHEIMIPQAVMIKNTPSPRQTGADKDRMDPVDVSRRPGPDHAGRERTDLHSQEATTVDTQDGNILGKQVRRLSGSKVSDGAHLQRKAERVNGSDVTLAPGHSRVMQDHGSLEQNNGRVATVGNSTYTDYDETREYISSETYPLAAEQIPGHLSVPAKIQPSP